MEDQNRLTTAQLGAAKKHLEIKSEVEANEALTSRADVGYTIFDNIDISGIVARQSLFPGAIFRGCTITDCDFSRSDFESVRFEGCSIKNTSFELCDIRSCKFVNCEIYGGSMQSAVFSDNKIKNSKFIAIDFSEASLLRCEFDHVLLKECINQGSSWLHTKFKQCELNSFSLSNCTASYSMFNACKYNGFKLNSDALGLSFGIAISDIEKIDFAFLGMDHLKTSNLSIDDFLNQYNERGWHLHYLMTLVSFGEQSNLSIWIKVFDLVKNQITVSDTAKRDDVEYLFSVANELCKNDQFPFAAAIYAFDIYSDLHNDDELLDRDSELIASIRRHSLSLVSTMNDRFVQAVQPLLEEHQNDVLQVEVVLQEKQAVDLLQYFDEIVLQPQNRQEMPDLISTRPGSWVETIQITLGSLFAFYISLFLIEGCLVRITMIKARSDKLLSKRLPKKFLDAANSPEHEIPANYLNMLKDIYLSNVSEYRDKNFKPSSSFDAGKIQEIKVKAN